MARPRKKTKETFDKGKTEVKRFPRSEFTRREASLIYIPATLAIAVGTIIIALVFSLVALHFLFVDRIYPGISVAKIDLAGLTKSQALQKVDSQITNRTGQKLALSYIDDSGKLQHIDFDLTGVRDQLFTNSAVDRAFEYGHSRIYFPPKDVNLLFIKKLDQKLAPLTDQVNKEPIDSEIKVAGSDINVTPSQDGYILDTDQFSGNILQFINTGKLTDNSLPMKKVQPHVDFKTASQIKKRLDQTRSQPLALTFKESSASAQKQTINLDFNTLLSLLDLQQDDYLNESKLDDYLKTLTEKIDRPVQEPLFNFNPNSPTKVTEFSPPVTGKKLDLQRVRQLLSKSLLDENIKEIELPVETIDPKNKLTNDLGIKELLGQGKSSFEGSINNRIFNLKLATSKLNGILVPPGEVFSFLESVGDISQATGYKQAFVIKSGKTVLDDGGGVCQVSTTMFRAVLNSGLPVLERNQHAYRVGYYELGGSPPGLDAAVFIPGVDFKFKNDTKHHILIQAYSEGNNLYFNFYGTSDGRVVEMTKPVITNRTPPPPELRQDDPTLPKGEVKQVEHAIEGANVVFSRKVIRDGQVLINESFRSNFRAWQAVYLVGTKEG